MAGNQVEFSGSWQEVLKQRRLASFQKRFIPKLETKSGYFRMVAFWMGVLFLLVFLGLVLYLSAVSVVLNVRYYATEWLRKESRIVSYRLFDWVSFKVPVGYVSKYGVDLAIVIPKIGVDAPIIENVSVTDYNEYMRALKKGVAHAQGTYLPGEGGRSYLFAHSTNIDPRWVSRYNAVFYLLSKMQKGDDVYVWRKGERLRYKVREVKIVDPDDTSYLSVEKKGEELVLQTCYPPGTTLRRLLVISELVEREKLK